MTQTKPAAATSSASEDKTQQRAWQGGLVGPSARKAREFADEHVSDTSEEEAAALLAAARKRADDWRTSTAAVLALITAALVLTDVRAVVGVLEPEVRRALAAAIGLSAFLGLASLWKVIRAANGPSWLDTRTRRLEGFTVDGVDKTAVRRDLRRARGAAHDLWVSQRLLAAAVLIFVGIVMTTWVYAPPPGG